MLKDRGKLGAAQRTGMDSLLARMSTECPVRGLRGILTRKQPNVARAPLNLWCDKVMCSKVARMYGFLEAMNGLFQSAGRKNRGYWCFGIVRPVVLLFGGKLNLSKLNPYA